MDTPESKAAAKCSSMMLAGKKGCEASGSCTWYKTVTGYELCVTEDQKTAMEQPEAIKGTECSAMTTDGEDKCTSTSTATVTNMKSIIAVTPLLTLILFVLDF